MGAAKISTKTFLIAVFSLVIIESAAAWIVGRNGSVALTYLGGVRLVEALTLILIAKYSNGGLTSLGLNRQQLTTGIKIGIKWSLVFAAAALIGFAALFILFEHSPFDLIKIRLPQPWRELLLFFVVGGIIGPITEEIVFRGVLFGYLAQWGVAAAILLSSLIFVFFHGQGGPIQAVGGVVFALAYHFSQSLTAPIIIHCLGNTALFSISLLSRYIFL